jgi:hypothetical protein
VPCDLTEWEITKKDLTAITDLMDLADVVQLFKCAIDLVLSRLVLIVFFRTS